MIDIYSHDSRNHTKFTMDQHVPLSIIAEATVKALEYAIGEADKACGVKANSPVELLDLTVCPEGYYRAYYCFDSHNDEYRTAHIYFSAAFSKTGVTDFEECAGR